MHFDRMNYPFENSYPITLKDSPDGCVMIEDVKIPTAESLRSTCATWN